ncbi:hypothetical protein XELAEV_18004109mg [Xenopus laevis]|uniref:Uncharacterized protein n=1 Tax=Xenopus laevis TaxID=8355 RepID=A0A974GZX7_XENLA|nr:hypothetical protein XELAEV_18004109mg [Xenopus laevis]
MFFNILKQPRIQNTELLVFPQTHSCSIPTQSITENNTIHSTMQVCCYGSLHTFFTKSFHLHFKIIATARPIYLTHQSSTAHWLPVNSIIKLKPLTLTYKALFNNALPSS